MPWRWHSPAALFMISTLKLSSRRIHTAMLRDYQAAVTALNTLQSNFTIVDAIRKSGKSLNQMAIPEMNDWCRRMGYQPTEFDCLKPIHVTGTKGKGSSSAFTSSILAQYLSPQTESHSGIRKIGLYTSPHLRFVRERIRINNAPLTEEKFAEYFFETWERLERSASVEGNPTDVTAKPAYFRFLTLMGLHTFIREGVDAAIIECGIGGEYDSTNILVHPIVTGITSLGIDHVGILGGTIEEIAWHKGGIMKSGSPAFTVDQPPPAMKMLKERAEEKGVDLKVVAIHPEIDRIQLGLAGDFQKINASLAIAMAATYLLEAGFKDIPDNITTAKLPGEFVRGLEQAQLGGRCEIRRELNITWHIDGGHTLESIEAAGKWFTSQIPRIIKQDKARRRLLLFNQQTRDAPALARALHGILAEALGDEKPFTHAIFCTNVTFRDAGYKPDLVSVNANSNDVVELKVQRGLAEAWNDIDSTTDVRVVRTIEDAVGLAREIARDGEDELMALVTGSLHLVGGFLDVLETTATD